MAMRASSSRSQRYTNVAIALHWLIALAIMAMLAIGLIMVRLLHTPGYQLYGFKLFQLHKSIGITILVLALLRLVWRLTHRPPPLPTDMRPVEKLAAEATHVLLYMFMIGLPLVGWAYVSASPFTVPTVLFGTIPWPHIGFLTGLPSASKAAVAPVLQSIHDYGAFALIGFVLLHVGAALKHYFVQHDTILQRMIPGLPRFGRPPDPRTNP